MPKTDHCPIKKQKKNLTVLITWALSSFKFTVIDSSPKTGNVDTSSHATLVVSFHRGTWSRHIKLLAYSSLWIMPVPRLQLIGMLCACKLAHGGKRSMTMTDYVVWLPKCHLTKLSLFSPLLLDAPGRSLISSKVSHIWASLTDTQTVRSVPPHPLHPPHAPPPPFVCLSVRSVHLCLFSGVFPPPFLAPVHPAYLPVCFGQVSEVLA